MSLFANGGRRLQLASLVLVVLALGVPAEFLAERAVGISSVRESVVLGLRIFQVVLGAHAILLWFAPRLQPPSAGTPLVGEDSVQGRSADSGTSPLAWLLTLLVVGLGLRLYDLGAGLWFDEIWTLVDDVRDAPWEIALTYEGTNQHMLYSLLAKGSFGLLGEGAAPLRVPAVAFGVGSIWATWWFGRRLGSDRQALLAAAVLTFSYHHVWFSQNARGYTGLLFWTLVSSALFLDMVRAETFSWARTLGYAASSALGAYTHLTALAVTAAHLLVFLFLAVRNRRRAVRPALRMGVAGLTLAGTLTLLLYAPVVPQVLDALQTPVMGGVETRWQSPVWMLTETIAGLARGLPGGAITVALVSVVLGAGFVDLFRRGKAAASVMILPALLVGIGALARDHNLWPRFFFFSAGFGALMLVRGVFRIGAVAPRRFRTRLATMIVMALFAGSAATVPRAWGPKQDYEGAARFLTESRAPNDAVVAVDMTAFVGAAYLHQDWRRVSSAAELARIEGSHDRTFVLYTFPTRIEAAHPDVWKRLRERYRKVAEFPGTVRSGEIVVMRSQPAAGPPRSGAGDGRRTDSDALVRRRR